MDAAEKKMDSIQRTNEYLGGASWFLETQGRRTVPELFEICYGNHSVFEKNVLYACGIHAIDRVSV